MSRIHEVAEAVGYYHAMLSRSWTDASAPPSFRPLPEGMPPSYGQCVPSSIVLLSELQRDFPSEEMRLAEGKVLAVSNRLGKAALQPIIPEHTWIDWQRPKWEEMCIIDVTADQAKGHDLPPYLVASYDELHEGNVVYQAYGTFDTRASLLAMYRQKFPDTTMPARIQLLQELFDQNKAHAISL